MTRRVFMSILGVAFYNNCRYAKGNFTGSSSPFVQKSLLEYLQQEENWCRDDTVLIFLTDQARQQNWNHTIETRFSQREKKDVPYIGLERILQGMEVSFRAVSIPEGKDEPQMWRIFELIFEQLQEGDEVYPKFRNTII